MDGDWVGGTVSGTGSLRRGREGSAWREASSRQDEESAARACIPGGGAGSTRRPYRWGS